MLIYEVRVDVPAETAEAFSGYMRGKHLPEIQATGCFSSIAFERASPTRFRTAYRADRREDLDRYLSEHAPAFRKDFLDHFPGGGCLVQRDVWETLETFV